MPKCDFNKVAKQFYWIALQHGCSPVNLLHIFRTAFSQEHIWMAASVVKFYALYIGLMSQTNYSKTKIIRRSPKRKIHWNKLTFFLFFCYVTASF